VRGGGVANSFFRTACKIWFATTPCVCVIELSHGDISGIVGAPRRDLVIVPVARSHWRPTAPTSRFHQPDQPPAAMRRAASAIGRNNVIGRLAKR
jgi:hypothetical protein